MAVLAKWKSRRNISAGRVGHIPAKGEKYMREWYLQKARMDACAVWVLHIFCKGDLDFIFKSLGSS